MDLKSLKNTTLAIVMGGGAGTRLFPLTQKRAKPAVPLGGKYSLVDIPISNCLNSGFRQVYVLDSERDRKRHHDPQLGPDGAAFYQEEAWVPKPDAPPVGIGRNCHIEGAIIDRN